MNFVVDLTRTIIIRRAEIGMCFSRPSGGSRGSRQIPAFLRYPRYHRKNGRLQTMHASRFTPGQSPAHHTPNRQLPPDFGVPGYRRKFAAISQYRHTTTYFMHSWDEFPGGWVISASGRPKLQEGDFESVMRYFVNNRRRT